MPNDKIGGDTKRGFASGGDEAHLSPFTTAKPIPETVVRRDVLGYMRADGVQLVQGLIDLGDTQLKLPTTMPDDATFLSHVSDGDLAWLSAEAAGGGAVEWGDVINTPITLGGYGITDAYTRTQIAGLFDGITFSDTGFGQPIGGIAARGQLPAALPYEDEANIFTLLNTFDGLLANTIDEAVLDAGVIVEGVPFVDGRTQDDYVEVHSDNLQSGTYHSLHQAHDEQNSAGHDEGGVITDGGGLTIDIEEGSGYFVTQVLAPNDLYYTEWADEIGFVLPDNQQSYIGVAWAGPGNAPTFTIKTSRDYNYLTEWPLGTVGTQGGAVVNIQSVPFAIRGGVNALVHRLYETAFFARANQVGLIVDETDDTVDFRYITMSDGDVWLGTVRSNVPEVNTLTGDPIEFVYAVNGGRIVVPNQRVWATDSNFIGDAVQDQWLWNDTTDVVDPLQQIPNNRYGVFWFALSTGGSLAGIYHDEHYIFLADAEEAPPPTWLADVAQQLIAKVVFQQGDDQGVFFSLWGTDGAAGSGTLVTKHGNLAGLTDDDHPGHPWLAGRVAGQIQYGGTTTGEHYFIRSNLVNDGNVYLSDLGGAVVVGTDPGGAQLLRIGGNMTVGDVSADLFAFNDQTTTNVALLAAGIMAFYVSGSLSAMINDGAEFWINDKVRAAGGIETDALAEYTTAAGITVADEMHFSAGTAAAPSIDFGDPTTGYYRVGSNQLGITSQGVRIATFQTGIISLGGTAESHKSIDLEGRAGYLTGLYWNGGTGAQTRWAILRDSTAESGANAGSNFSLRSFNDAGALLSVPMTINRATDAAVFAGALQVATLTSLGALSATTGTFTNVVLGSPPAPIAYRIHAYHPTTNTVALFESGDATVWVAFADSGSTSQTSNLFGVVNDQFQWRTGGTDRAILSTTVFRPASAGLLQLGSVTNPWGATFVGALTATSADFTGLVNIDSASHAQIVLDRASNANVSRLNFYTNGALDWYIDTATGASDNMTFYSNGVGTALLLNSATLAVTCGGALTATSATVTSQMTVEGATNEMVRLKHTSASGNPFISFYQAGTRRWYIQGLDSGNTLSLVSEYGAIGFYTHTAGSAVKRGSVSGAGAWDFENNTVAMGALTATTGTFTTTSTNNILTVTANTSGVAYLRLNSAGVNIGGVFLQDATTDKFGIFRLSDSLFFRDYVATNHDYMTVVGNGNMTLSPAGGTTNVTGILAVTGALTAGGTIIGDTTVRSSGSGSASMQIYANTDNAYLHIRGGMDDAGAEEAKVIFSARNSVSHFQAGVGSDLHFVIYDGIGAQNAFKIESNGSMTLSPASGLTTIQGNLTQIGTLLTYNSMEIRSTASANLAINSDHDNTGSTLSRIYLQDDSVTKWTIQKTSGNSFQIYDDAGSDSVMLADTNGDLTFNPGGDIKIIPKGGDAYLTATRIGMFDITTAVAQAAHITNPLGGLNIDTQCRAQLNLLLTAIENIGITAKS